VVSNCWIGRKLLLYGAAVGVVFGALIQQSRRYYFVAVHQNHLQGLVSVLNRFAPDPGSGHGSPRDPRCENWVHSRNPPVVLSLAKRNQAPRKLPSIDIV